MEEVLNLSKIDEFIKKKTIESEEWIKDYVEESLKLELSVLLTQLRETTRLDMDDFSKKIGISKDIIERIEDADYDPSVTLIKEIAFKLDKRIELKISDK